MFVLYFHLAARVKKLRIGKIPINTIILIFSIVIFLHNCSRHQLIQTKEESVRPNILYMYFTQVALGSEFGNDPKVVKKWKKDILIFTQGYRKKSLMEELKKIIFELNNLVKPLELRLVDIKKEANLVIYFGSAHGYAKAVEPSARAFLKDNYGFFKVYFNQKYEITYGSMYVNTQKLKQENALKHVLREELTQSLGLMNDSPWYKDSIFYSSPTGVTEFSKMDRALIRFLYSDRVKSGMNKLHIRSLLVR